MQSNEGDIEGKVESRAELWADETANMQSGSRSGGWWPLGLSVLKTNEWGYGLGVRRALYLLEHEHQYHL
eukprot:g61766.t1